MQTIPLLQGRKFVEAVPSDAPPVLHLAAAFAGRIAVDLGADVARVQPQADPIRPLKSHAEERLVDGAGVLQRFLDNGKTWCSGIEQALPADVIFTAAAAVAERAGGAGVVQLSAFAAGCECTPVSELALLALSGLADLLGDPARAPVALGGHQAAFTTGYAAFTAAMALLAGRELQGVSEQATVDALSSLAWINWKAGASAAMGTPTTREGEASEWPVLPCADGYFALVYLERDWPALCAMIGDERLSDQRFAAFKGRQRHRVELRSIITNWMCGRSKAELFEAFRLRGIPGGPVLTPADQLTDPLLAHRGSFAKIKHGDKYISVPLAPCRVTMAEAGPANASSKRPSDRGGLPLAGIRVIDLGIITAGAGTSALLADLGAEVLKVEAASYPDPFRAWAGVESGDSPLFKFNNRNKRGIALDLKTVADRQQFLALVAGADVVLENFRRGVLDRLDLGFDVLRRANPRIVLASISGQGQSGPGADHVTYGSTLEALSGLAALTGYPGEQPLISGRNLNYPDQIVCLFAAAATMAVLLRARQQGAAAHVDIAQRDVALYALGDRIAAASLLAVPPQTWLQGNAAPDQLLQGIYAAADGGWLAVSIGTMNEMRAFEKLLGQPVVTDGSLAGWVAERTAEAGGELLREAGIAAYAVLDGGGMFNHPAVQRGTAFAQSPSGQLVKGFPFQLAKRPMTIYAESPGIGEHTAEILSRLGGGAKA
jgi:crotonobetainyl-CoA:carnitine CoA-transferase CaiB-like acyl-CoA transferase